MEASPIWYATEERLRSRAKLIVYDAVGTMTVNGRSIEFRSPSARFRLHDVAIPAPLVRQTWNRTVYLWAGVFLLVFFALFNLVLAPAGLAHLTLRFVAIELLMTLVLGGLGYLIGHSTKWIELEGLDDSGEQTRCYVCDGDAAGWSGIFGGTERLRQQAGLA